MSTRLYYTDSTLRTFDATVVSCRQDAGRTLVVLNRTAFYPTSGGQPCDTGRLGGVAVLDVFDADDGDVVHVTERPIEAGVVVTGEIDWPRRFDHMQQHTGQHVLSAAFDRLFDVRTMSVHFGAETSTIDLSREVSARELAATEAKANRVVWDDRVVQVRFATDVEARELPLRKEPTRGGTLRLVEVPDCDLSACGGTHVPRTGVIGMIAATGVERVKGASRVTFVCGGRALRSHGTLRDVVLGATRALSVTQADLVAAIEKSQLDARDAHREIRRLQDALARYRAEELRSTAETIGPHRVVLMADLQLDAAALKGLASAVVSADGTVAVLVGGGTPVPTVIACSADAACNASALMRDAAVALGGRGGGTATLAQGGLASTAEQVLEFVKDRLSGAP